METTPNLKLKKPGVNDNILYTDLNDNSDIIDEAVSNLQKIVMGAVADVTTLKAIDTTNLSDNILILVKSLGYFRFDSTSSVTPDDVLYIQPTTGPGRWIDIEAAHKADMTYQTPTIVGTQIQIQKQSDTTRLYFKLDADLSGGAITISLDAGATDLPLQDIDGNAVTELSKSFVEVVEDTTFFTLRPRGAKLESVIVIEKLDDKKTFNVGQARGVLSSGNNIYLLPAASQDVNKKILKIEAETLTSIDEAPYLGDIDSYGNAIDEEYLFVVSVNTGNSSNDDKLLKIRLSDMTVVAERKANYQFGTVYTDGINVYVGETDFDGTLTYHIRKLNYNTLAIEDGLQVDGYARAFASDGTHIFVGGDFDSNKIYKLNISDMTKVSESISLGAKIERLKHDGINLFSTGGNPKYVRKIDPSTLSIIASSGTTYTSRSLVIKDELLYISGIYEINKDTLVTTAQSTTYSETAGMYIDYNYSKDILFATNNDNSLAKLLTLYRKV